MKAYHTKHCNSQPAPAKSTAKKQKTLQLSYRIDTVRLQRYKEARKKGLSRHSALLAAGFSPSTARCQPQSLKSAKIGDVQILNELKAKDYTIERLIERLEFLFQQAKAMNDLTNYREAVNLMGKFLNAWKTELKIECELKEPELIILEKYTELLSTGRDESSLTTVNPPLLAEVVPNPMVDEVLSNPMVDIDLEAFES